MFHQHHAGHQHHKAPMEKRQDAGTVVQYVYKTAAKTFDGPVGGYKTVAAQPENTPSSDSSPNSNSNSNSNSNANKDNSNSGSQQQAQEKAAQQAAQQSAEAAASSAVVSEAIAKAMATQQKAAAQTTVAAATTEQKAQATPTPEKTEAAAKGTSTSSSKRATEATKSPVAAATSDKAVASSPTSSFIESTSSSSSTPSQTAAASSGSSGGLSSGGKAGLAIGILLLIGLLLAGLFFCYRRKKSREAEAYGKADDEKSAYAGDLNRANTTASTRTTATAPRLSLRPVTQFLPDLASKGKAANAAGVAGGAAGGAAAGAAMASTNQNDPANPFSNHSAVQPSQRLSDEEKIMLPIQGTPAENPFADNAAAPGSMQSLADAPAPLRIRTPNPEAAATAGAAGGLLGAGAVAATKHNERNHAPKALDLSPNRPVSPAGTSPAVSEFSQTPVSPGAMANGPPPSNVHRIQLDFKPSMDDELSLRAGQLVRLLHEYDDGWALCIRLDRSQQGVAPRTCLSARPVKPRPPPGARAGPGPRGPSPPGMMGPGQQRPQSPAGGRGSISPYGRQPRLMSSGPNRGHQQRSMSPGPYGGGPQSSAVIPAAGSKRRSNSASDTQARRMSPPGPSPMNPNVQRVPMQQQAVTSPDSASITNRTPPVSVMPPTRKPVPGQAM